VRGADYRYMLDYWGLALKQASDGLRETLERAAGSPATRAQMEGRGMRPATSCPGRARPRLHHRVDSHAADFAMTLGEFYCKGLTAPVMVEIKRDDVVFARVYDIRGRSISSLLAIPAP